MKLAAWGLSDVGRKRDHNEDSFLVSRELGLFVVADGMGGHAGGDRASRTAVDAIERQIASSQGGASDGSGWDEADAPLLLLRNAVQAASAAIFEQAQASPELQGMGTTVTALLVRSGQAHVAHVGDSRAYRVRDGAVAQLTEDHTWINEQMRAGALTAAEARDHQYRHVITRSVGFERDVSVDTAAEPLLPGDCFLLCSDGLSSYVEADELGRILAETEPRRVPVRLVGLANDRGGEDNVTIVLVQILPAPA